jgi:hypothetical protein
MNDNHLEDLVQEIKDSIDGEKVSTVIRVAVALIQHCLEYAPDSALRRDMVERIRDHILSDNAGVH